MMEFEDKVYKKCNLEHNDSISTYNGWAAQQNYKAFEVFHDFIQNVKPKRILEIGTSIGGFTQFLKYTCDNLELDTHIISLDIHEKHINHSINLNIVGTANIVKACSKFKIKI